MGRNNITMVACNKAGFGLAQHTLLLIVINYAIDDNQDFNSARQAGS